VKVRLAKIQTQQETTQQTKQKQKQQAAATGFRDGGMCDKL